MSLSDWHAYLRSPPTLSPLKVALSSEGFICIEPENFEDTSKPQLFELSEIACLFIEGPDAAKFLQGQITCDINEVSETQFRRGAICNLQGRMICSFRIFQESPSRFGLLMHRGLIDGVLQWLSKYIVFSKAKLQVDEVGVALGISGSSPNDLPFESAAWPNDTQSVIKTQSGFILRVAQRRYLAWLPLESAKSLWASLASRTHIVDARAWHRADIRDGLAEVFPATANEFIPQMLNLQDDGGVSFKKGCYIGQEIVARMQYLGKLKRHLQHARVTAREQPVFGQSLFGSGTSQSIGNIVNTAPIGPDTFEVLAVVSDASREADAVFLDPDGGDKLHFLSPPYAITK